MRKRKAIRAVIGIATLIVILAASVFRSLQEDCERKERAEVSARSI